MIHTIAFSGSQTSTSTALQNISAVSDPTLRTSGNFVFMPAMSNLVGEYAIGTAIKGAQLQAPSLKKLFNYDLTPLEVHTVPGTPTNYLPHYSTPYLLQPNEGLQALVVESTTAANINSVIVELSDGVVQPVSPVGSLTVKATFTVLAGNYGWSNSTLTLSQTLPVGDYDCIGARVEVTNGIYARFFPVGALNRPGVTVRQAAGDIDLPFERRGGKGVLFTFNQLTPPSVDLFHNGATGTATVYLDLVPRNI